MSSKTYVDTLELVRSERFRELWAMCHKRFVPWSEFSTQDAPDACDINYAFAVMTALRHSSATLLPFDNYIPEVSTPDNWFSVTEDMYARLSDIVATATDGSRLNVMLQEYITERGRVLLLADEIVSCARRDGIALDLDHVVAVMNGSLEPQEPHDVLVHNVCEALTHTGHVERRPISPGFIAQVNESLVGDVHFSEKPKARPRIQNRKPSILDEPYAALCMASGLATGEGTCATIHPIFRAMLVSGIFWEFSPFPQANALTELVVRGRFFVNEGLSALRWVRFSHISERWEHGMLVKPKMPCAYLEPVPDVGEGYDSTGHFTCSLILMQYELERLYDKLKAARSSSIEAVQAFENLEWLNPRQREVLLFLYRNPDSRVSIDAHKRTYDIAYATARQDLVGLENAGYLSQLKRGRAFLYQATPALGELVRHGAD